MKVRKSTDIFNLMDTNGRRADVINALQGYLGILDEIVNVKHMQWKHMPYSTAQYHFYERAYQFSKGVFKKNDNYAAVLTELEKNPQLKAAIYDGNAQWLSEHKSDYARLFKKIDNGIEDRARHYTSNLVKLGFADSDRNITKAGEALIGKRGIVKDEYERLLPVNDMNILYMRQLMKLRIYTNDGARFYSPFCMAIFCLLKKGRMSQSEFSELVQSQNPYNMINDLDEYVLGYHEGQYLESFEVKVPDEITGTERLDKDVFRKWFKNGKTSESVDKYYEFYQVLYDFDINRNSETLDKLLIVWEKNKDALKKAFGSGKNIISFRTGERPEVEDFLERLDKDGVDLFGEDFNKKLYISFARSKRADDLREKSDTTKRIFSATGIISYDNGYVELAYRELCENMFDINRMRSQCMRKVDTDGEDSFDMYEGGADPVFGEIQSLVQIMNCTAADIEKTFKAISEEFDGADISDIPAIMKGRRRDEFEKFVEDKYPADRVKWLLSLFSNRDSDKKNDALIKKEVNPDATVPTIFEYVTGLAWYYFSGKRINILDSYNLTLSADFEPITHAGGGAGDIVIREKDKIVMLEITLMNTNSQKRGEWEPVLRHSVNLKAEEEERSRSIGVSAGDTDITTREVTTFFIADSFDMNTINIWKAVASVPLQSTTDKNMITDNVVIMPVNISELAELMDRSSEYDSIIADVHKLFEHDRVAFNMNWREDFMAKIFQPVAGR